ncbi:protein translocase subunit SecF [Ketobacter sp. MCCC 1A13808]|uniref:protein translocase subunit SecF n=1 Tax=Ketobacter sp. MCCC 1A13808 TaxID=2602738 RepID=UPI000F234E8A|nr:protein translocase subunit SecF [Ketobacter sp. MCCC 1A13808]MVF14555.1 protein translocase subunit SecF [Ketobacter sp. MCCC 1A13808]RLP54165.1 MAG: protein translocase subunit SecF [Ketobacter sp.]
MNKTTTFNFMGARHIMGAMSVLLIIGSIISISINFLELGLDFTGGTQIEVEYPQAAQLEAIRDELKGSAYPDATVQHFGRPEEVLVRVPPVDGEDKDQVGAQILQILQGHSESVRLKRVEFVGPQVGEELRDKSGTALILALGLMLIYITLRFRFKFAVGAVMALFHDVIITMGFFSVTRLTFDLTALAAILAVIGYSLNDTIVVFDRVRENFRRDRGATPAEIINNSLNQTLSRTLVTSLTTLLVLIALALLGGEMIFAFAIALIVGIVVGTYSSIYVASNLLLVQKISREDFMEQEKAADDMP